MSEGPGQFPGLRLRPRLQIRRSAAGNPCAQLLRSPSWLIPRAGDARTPAFSGGRSIGPGLRQVCRLRGSRARVNAWAQSSAFMSYREEENV